MNNPEHPTAAHDDGRGRGDGPTARPREAFISCGGARHRVVLTTRGRLGFDRHRTAELERELGLALPGDVRSGCAALLAAWRSAIAAPLQRGFTPPAEIPGAFVPGLWAAVRRHVEVRGPWPGILHLRALTKILVAESPTAFEPDERATIAGEIARLDGQGLLWLARFDAPVPVGLPVIRLEAQDLLKRLVPTGSTRTALADIYAAPTLATLRAWAREARARASSRPSEPFAPDPTSQPL